MSIPAEAIEDYFAENEYGELIFTNDPEKFGNNNADRVRALAITLVFARKVGGYDRDGTTYDTLKAECERLGIYDAKNFSTQLNGISKWVIPSGSGVSRTFKTKPSTKDEARKRMGVLHE
ncbi:hypothetical protein ER308_10665 [Egibacter rhizosphaerae]|uniref:Uncharacterized protein n=1 Tax=Egibacter rhizosphaerae TaxID=1670831 RepID=A0A411YFL4_9ACTN|nr:hypothetical protein [Egibacter rhizosphaerae]QBI19976.1 hypothetical protein ER308_10665 [Egibacter rhizosphaerae]